MMEFLLAKGADPNVTNNEGFNALDVAVHRMSYKAAKYLYDHCDMKFKSSEEYAPNC